MWIALIIVVVTVGLVVLTANPIAGTRDARYGWLAVGFGAGLTTTAVLRNHLYNPWPAGRSISQALVLVAVGATIPLLTFVLNRFASAMVAELIFGMALGVTDGFLIWSPRWGSRPRP